MREHTYIWINPVSAGMYEPETMTALLTRHNCKAVQCQYDWGGTRSSSIPATVWC